MGDGVVEVTSTNRRMISPPVLDVVYEWETISQCNVESQ